MVTRRVLQALRGSFGPRAEVVPASRVPGAELVRLGGGEMVPTPGVPDLPTAEADRVRGLCGATLALPPAEVRVLNGVQIWVGENVVRTRSGAVVGGSASERLRGLPRRHSGSQVALRLGSAALYGSMVPGTFEALIETLPSVLLLQHPAMRTMSPVSVLWTGRAALAEGFLVERLENRQVRLEVVTAGSAVEPERTLVAAPVSREGSGALTRWYRRWIDQQSASAKRPTAERRLLLTHGPRDRLRRSPEIVSIAGDHGFVSLDTVTGALGEGDTLDAEGLVATLRDATAVLGAEDDALGHAAFCRRAEVVHVGVSDTVSPRVAQLAASRALPYSFVHPDALSTLLADR